VRLAVMFLIDGGLVSRHFQVACMNELGNVVAGRQTNMNGMFRPGASIIIFQPLSQRMSSDADNSIHLRVERFGAPEGLHGNAVLLDFVDGSLEILVANKCQKSNRVVCPPEYAGR